MSEQEVIGFEEFAREALGGEEDGWTAYPWQVRFAERCADPEAEPPSWLVAPTGSGKTAAIDALVWALARQAYLGPTERTAATRIVWAIDRRILVDEVNKHAEALADRLDDALDAGPDHPLHDVALRLYRLACADRAAEPPARAERDAAGLRPLAVQRWRGGIADRDSLLYPSQPQIITSTVAQIGSRLLFRGYGVGRRSLQVAAGLAAVDTTICLDEAHLALAFRETVGAIAARRDAGALALPRLNLLTLTATPPDDVDRDGAVELDEDDHARLGGRWSGEKTLELREEPAKPAKALAAAVEEMLEGGGRVIACVANKVQIARDVHRELAKKLADEARVALLIGPQRQADREDELREIGPVLFDDAEPERPIVVVATQAIEVGLDADFDSMVTQSASASAVTQRLGRLNRSGKRPGRCLLLRDTRSRLYEDDEPAAWEWLQGRPGSPTAIDISVAALSAPNNGRPPDRPPAPAATLTPAVVEQLSQTSPRPAPFADPALEPLLEGVDAEPNGDVQIVWRRDLRFSLDGDGDEGTALRAYRRDLLDLARPQPRELLTVSIADARLLLGGWLDDPRSPRNRKHPGGEEADVEGARPAASPSPPSTHASFLVVRGGEVLHGVTGGRAAEGEIVLGELAPRDTIVVPSSLSSEPFGSWAARGPGFEVGDVMGDRKEPSVDPRSDPTRLALRFGWEALTEDPEPNSDEKPGGPSPQQWLAIARQLQKLTGEESARPIPADRLSDALSDCIESLPLGVRAWLGRLVDEEASLRLRRATPALSREEIEAEEVEAEVEPDPPDDAGKQTEALRLAAAFPLFAQVWVATPARASAPAPAVERRVPTVAQHCRAVRKRVSRFGTCLGLAPAELQALELAALAHDLGKLDGRMQDFLWGGSAPSDREPIAKSVFGTDDPAAERQARQRAGLPRSLRHEAESVEILASALRAGAIPEDLSDADPELSLVSTGTHHGEGLALWPVEWGGSPQIEFDADLLGIAGRAGGTNRGAWMDGEWLRLLFDLRQRLGHWELAYLQALLAIADRTVSREGG